MRTSASMAACLLIASMAMVAEAQKLHRDPPSMVAVSASAPIKVDGELDEADWTRHFFFLNFRAGYKPDDASYSVSGSDLPTKNLPGTKGYTDTSSTVVYFMHYGTDLYIGVRSTDSSVCKRWGAWEGDGLFTKFRSKSGTQVIEYKLMYNSETSSHAVLETSGNAPAQSAEGASYEFPGTIVNDNSAPDHGYSLELVIHLDKLGYSASDTVLADITIMDPDFYTRDTTESSQPGIVQFYKSWWGTEWGGSNQPTDYRQIILADVPVMDAYATSAAITLDGRLDEPQWKGAPSMIIGPNSKDATNWWFMQWGDTLASYNDPSYTVVKFLHKGTDLYIGFISNDSSVCQWSTGWEADGMFIWMRDKFTLPGPANRQEVKLMFFGDSVGGPAKFEVNNNVPTGGAEGKDYEFPGTVTRTETNGKDKGYSGEIIIHGDKWGYVDGDTILLAIVMWDMDRSSADVTDPHQRIYAKAWWGSEWADINFDKYYMYRGVYLSPRLVGVKEEPTAMPNSFSLSQNYPNPFNPTTIIQYAVPQIAHVTLKIYNVYGQEVATLVDKIQSAGSYQVSWDGKDNRGRFVASGVYFYRLEAGANVMVRKMVMLK